MSKVVVVRGEDPEKMVKRGLDYLEVEPDEDKIVIKPNLIDNRPYPVTTSAETVEAIVKYFKKFGKEIIIAEGSGWCNTFRAYEGLGYLTLREKYDLKLVDLNRDEFLVKKNPNAIVLKKFEFPLTLEGSYLISAAVLKIHSFTGVTLSMKNMLGASIGSDKGRFHRFGINESIVDINTYKLPNLAIVDGRMGNIDGELGGRVKKFGLMIFSKDPVAADAIGADILGKDPLSIKYLKTADQRGLGTANLDNIERIDLA
ncbi:MAG: DUF362 domain-containing protein [Candidatus Hydrothermarchaeota archaeon]